jgi:nickel-dependent lactate racemase
MATGKGGPDNVLLEEDVQSIIADGTPAKMFENKRILVLTPDATRTCPLPMMIRAIQKVLGTKAAKLDFMVALGTHTPLPEKEVLKLYGLTTQQKQTRFPNSLFLNHRWDQPQTFRRIGYLSEEEIENVSQGHLREKVPIDINKIIYDYDLVVILGPVFPHEVVGFSGGAKYLFPGISGGEFLHFFHWLGAVMTCRNIIGIKDTPVRQLINRAAEKIEVPVTV